MTRLQFEKFCDELLPIKKAEQPAQCQHYHLGPCTKVLGNGGSSDIHAVEVDGIVVQIGLAPNSQAFADVAELNQRGEIIIDDRSHTSYPGRYAVGDVTTIPFK